MAKDKCRPYDLSSPYFQTTPGAQEARELNPEDGPGRYCVSVWASDDLDQVGPAVSTWVDVP
jgi:hypothetical protein